MSLSDLPEPDRAPGAPHPRDTVELIGQSQAETAFLDAFNGGRLHHGWLLTGPRGIGKATLAWRIARFLLATPPDAEDGLFGAPPAPQTLDIDPEHPVSRRLLAGSEPGLFLLRRGGAGSRESEQQKNYEEGKFSAVIRVDEVRKLSHFLHMSATEGGRRVVIVDAADEMNPSASNALLKLLEEPPANTTLLLVCHQPSRLLPTIRSRCRTLRLHPLGADDLARALQQTGNAAAPDQTLALAELAQGSVGDAVNLVQLNGLTLYAQLIDLLGTLPNMDRPRALALAESAAGRGKEERLGLLLGLLDIALARLARTGATGLPPRTQAAPHESTVMARLAPNPDAARAWAAHAQTTTDRTRHARAVNLDPSTLVLDALLRLMQPAE